MDVKGATPYCMSGPAGLDEPEVKVGEAAVEEDHKPVAETLEENGPDAQGRDADPLQDFPDIGLHCGVSDVSTCCFWLDFPCSSRS